MTHKPELGIKDPYELNEDQYKAALELLRGQRQIVSRYWHDAFVQIDDFKNEGVVASSSWPFQVNLLQSEKQPIASTVPEEGATGWADTTMMHADAPHPNCAYHVAGAFAQPEAAGRPRGLVRLGAGGARRLQGQRAARPTPAARPTAIDNFDKIAFWKTPIVEVRVDPGDGCVPYYRWVSRLHRHPRRALSRD